METSNIVIKEYGRFRSAGPGYAWLSRHVIPLRPSDMAEFRLTGDLLGFKPLHEACHSRVFWRICKTNLGYTVYVLRARDRRDEIDVSDLAGTPLYRYALQKKVAPSDEGHHITVEVYVLDE